MKSTSSLTPKTHFFSDELLIKYEALVFAVLASLVSRAINNFHIYIMINCE